MPDQVVDAFSGPEEDLARLQGLKHAAARHASPSPDEDYDFAEQDLLHFPSPGGFTGGQGKVHRGPQSEEAEARSDQSGAQQDSRTLSERLPQPSCLFSSPQSWHA